MKRRLLDFLVCPSCLPKNAPFDVTIIQADDDDIEVGTLACTACGAVFPIHDGIAHLDPFKDQYGATENKYEHQEVVSSYLWSHYSDLFDQEYASEAYAAWSRQINPAEGIGVDAGGAVGRFTFELSTKCDFAIGVDNSVAFVQTARQLMKERSISFALKDEGLLTRAASFTLPESWQSEKVEFIVGNALALPLRSASIAAYASLNLIDKVPSPLRHLREMNRVTRDTDAQFLLSDPFSWSTEAAPVEEWLGGKKEGLYAGKGLDNVVGILSASDPENQLPWQIMHKGKAWWKIRTHTNHYELIQSCYLKASR
ncbi:Trm112 family protein [Desulfogranum marinum]|uniref:class I SAM-dependent methyltransferase n=1 Tax=Desulfogranum marinum TaxID=453220 RepID=UPI0029C7554A|nr:Trm112 family protein [Desulfogranum marinum]